MKCIAALVLVLALVAGIAVNGSQAQTMNATSVAFEHTREGNHDVLGANAPTIPPIHQAATVIGTVAGQMIPEPVGRTPVVRVIPDIPTITGGGLENSAALPTQDVWQRQFAAGKSICPTVQELNASRQQLAREVLHSPNPTEAYKIALAKHAGDWLTRCRAQIDWAISLLKQTPEGRAYLARVVARVNERLRLECGCEGAWVVFDAGTGDGSGGSSYWSRDSSPQTMALMQCSGCPQITRVNVNPANMSPEMRALVLAGGALALSGLVGAGVLTAAEAAQIAALLGFLGAYQGFLRSIDSGGTGGGGGGSGGGSGCDRPCGDR